MKIRTRLITTTRLGLTLVMLVSLQVLGVRPHTVRANPGDLFVKPISRVSDCTMSKPCPLQTALNKALDGDTIYLAGGTYTSSGEAVAVLTKTVKLYGGWNGLVAKIPVRNPEMYPSILDGENQRRVVYVNGVISPTLDGLIITGGDAGNSSASPTYGGGIYSYDANLVISNSVISSNFACADCGSDGAGGGMYLENSMTTLSDNVIISNTASTSTSGYGGGLYFDDSPATLIGNTIVSNTAALTGDGEGGGLYFDDSDATLSGNTVQGNTAAAGDGLCGGLYLASSSATLTGNMIQNNTASTAGNGKGGGVCISNRSVTLDGNMITGNTATLNPSATGLGGGLSIRNGASFTMTNNIVADNHANTGGSGLWIYGSSSLPTSGQLLHNTIADNHSSGEGISVGEYTTLAFTNTIIAGHSSTGITVTAGSKAMLESTLWYNSGSDTGGGGTIEIGTNNIYGDPAFANPSAWDYHLTFGSPAIDVGINAGVTTDIDGDPRPWPADGAYDIGADEVWWRYVYLPLVLQSSP